MFHESNVGKMTRLRNDEAFVISRVAEEMNADWRPGENPPDCYLTIGNTTYPVDISQLSPHVTDVSGNSRPRNSDDVPTLRICDQLDAELKTILQQ